MVILICIMIVEALLKIREVVFEYLKILREIIEVKQVEMWNIPITLTISEASAFKKEGEADISGKILFL